MAEFKIMYDGVDGTDVMEFDTLAEAGKYLAARYQGADYCSGGHLGTDYAKYFPVGFDLSDVGKWVWDGNCMEFYFFDWAGGTKPVPGDYDLFAYADCDGHEDEVLIASVGSLKEAIELASNYYHVHGDIGVKCKGKKVGWFDSEGWNDQAEHDAKVAAEKAAYEKSLKENPAPF